MSKSSLILVAVVCCLSLNLYATKRGHNQGLDRSLKGASQSLSQQQVPENKKEMRTQALKDKLERKYKKH